MPIKPGDTVLDYGCGTGSYTFIMAKIVGPQGRVIAVDIHPLAISHVNNLIKSRDVKNVVTVLTDCDTDLDDESVNVILLFDTQVNTWIRYFPHVQRSGQDSARAFSRTQAGWHSLFQRFSHERTDDYQRYDREWFVQTGWAG